MRHWLTILLLMFLPLQASWAVVAGYCQHETGQASQHVGHHDHQHVAQQTVANPALSDDSTSDSSPSPIAGGDMDCAACHANCAPGVPGVLAPGLEAEPHGRPLALPTHPRSAPAETPDRPNWVRLA